jgi:hypothetical protein
MVLGTVLEPLAIRLPFLIMLTGALAERLHQNSCQLSVVSGQSSVVSGWWLVSGDRVSAPRDTAFTPNVLSHEKMPI